MKLVTLDFETHYSSEYSLNKMSPLEYVRDKRFQLISCATKIDGGRTEVDFGIRDIKRRLAAHKADIENGMVIAHNLLGFDAYVAAYILGINPKMWGCTMSMARPIFAKTVGLGLAKLVAHFAKELQAMGISPVKNNAVLVSTRGKRLEDFTQAELDAMASYNGDDTDQCYGIFALLRRHFTPGELWQIDALVRMRTEPAFQLNIPMLQQAASIERVRKHSALLDLARTLKLEDIDWGDEKAITERIRADLASAPKFTLLLEGLGVEVPTKPSPKNPEKFIPALAKTDEAFLALQEHDNPMVVAAAMSRLDVKSTLLETRLEKLTVAGTLAGGLLPVPLRYCGADTTGRDSGEEYNMQNLPRINKKVPKTTDALRNSLGAPKGKKIIVADQSGIELRVNHFLWKVKSSMLLYQNSPDKADLYRTFAAHNLFHIKPEDVDPQQRQLGKVAQLGLGFGAGHKAFKRVAKTQGGIDLFLDRQELLDDKVKRGILVPDPANPDEWIETVHEDDPLTSSEIVESWRGAYSEITDGWAVCKDAILWISQGIERAVDPWGLVTTCKEGLRLPSGRLIRYPHLRKEEDGEWPDGGKKYSWFYAHGRHKARITGPKMTENIVQALARDSIFECAIDYFKVTKLRPNLRVHDELVYVVDERHAQELLDELQHILRRPPKWWPELVVWSEGGISNTYGSAK